RVYIYIIIRATSPFHSSPGYQFPLPTLPAFPEPAANFLLPRLLFICWSVGRMLCGSATIPVEPLFASPIGGLVLERAKVCSRLYSQFSPPKSALSRLLWTVQLPLSL